MGLTSDDIDELMIEVWAPGVELDLYHAEHETGPRAFTASLIATGGWDGHVVVRATESFARAVAARMFGIPRGEVGAADAADAVGELVNVVGGNLKSLLGEEAIDLDVPHLGVDVTGGTEVARSVLAAAPGFEVTVAVIAGGVTAD